ncbi:2-keto-4-pentenoate hydratase [Sphingomonas sp. RP10(2022)]|uniref:2-keto-4-pentenoate hydratase n=1 Tax=Sphingomonas liriopis TaxID=2949094 RepID=A0A9X2HQZ2_9SPHN|nr:2-keto-4-pentenoate hydratase [Sphingomonas liriopis]MCP3735563.1 2-keto-4-pentenoate hydratase [Sphingomonas liriopis]
MPQTDTASVQDIARAFVTARRDGHALPDYPGAIPADLATAYRVQDAALAFATGEVVGWKVGRINPPIDGIDRLSGPIFAATVFDATDGDLPMPIFADGFGAAEAEFLIRIGTAPDPAKTRYTMAEARDLIDAVHVGIEIASSPFPGINALGATVTISDFGNNNGLVVGAAIPDWRDVDLNQWPITLDINGTRIGAATAAAMLDGPVGAARFLFDHMAARGIQLQPGQWISSGAVTGVHPVAVGDRVEASFDGRYTVGCTITAR